MFSILFEYKAVPILKSKNRNAHLVHSLIFLAKEIKTQRFDQHWPSHRVNGNGSSKNQGFLNSGYISFPKAAVTKYCKLVT